MDELHERLKRERLERITDEAVLERIQESYRSWRTIRAAGVKQAEPVITAAYVADWFSDDNSPWRQTVREHCENVLRRLHRAGRLNVSEAQQSGCMVKAYDPAE